MTLIVSRIRQYARQRTPVPVPTMPGPRFIGQARAFRHDRLALFEKIRGEYGDIAAFHVGPRTLVLVSTPALSHEVLVTKAAAFEKPFNLRAFTKPLFGNGLVTSLNAFHGRQRKLVAPAFQHRRVAAYADVMAQDAERIVGEWTDGQTVDVAHEMTRLTLWIVGATLFGADVSSEASDLSDPLVRANRFLIRRTNALFPMPLWLPTKTNKLDREAITRLDKIVYRMIAERRANPGDRGDLLSMLLSARDADDGSFMNDQQVRDEAMTLFLAGHETTATALAWTWYLLSRPHNEHIYAQMLAEVDTVLGRRTPSFADLKQLPYTLQVLKESMRLYPPVPTVAREASEDVVVAGRTFPRKTIFVVNPYTIHRDPAVWNDPKAFDPNRFAGGAEARMPKGSYIPFIIGPRNCIGSQFAAMEGHILLAALAQRVTFELTEGQTVEPEALITLRPRHGIKMIVHRR